MKKNKGFTLIELLVVIAIIGIVSSVVFVSLNIARQRARTNTAQSTMRSLMPIFSDCLSSGITYPIESNTGGSTAICSLYNNTYLKLPIAWSWCDGTDIGACGSYASLVTETSFEIVAINSIDGKVIICSSITGKCTIGTISNNP